MLEGVFRRERLGHFAKGVGGVAGFEGIFRVSILCVHNMRPITEIVMGTRNIAIRRSILLKSVIGFHLDKIFTWDEMKNPWEDTGSVREFKDVLGLRSFTLKTLYASNSFLRMIFKYDRKILL
jgi:hypothetical protein